MSYSQELEPYGERLRKLSVHSVQGGRVEKDMAEVHTHE